MPTVAELADRVDSLEERLDSLENAPRPGRKAKKMIAPNKPGVCGLVGSTKSEEEWEKDPVASKADLKCSEECEDASIYRYQKGCKGTACVRINSEYYTKYRRQKAADE